jgi:hypothetical protein
MQRLKAYIRRTVLTSATEGAYPKKRHTKESTHTAFLDASRGTDTGWWNDLIYTRDVLDLFNRYRSDVAATVRDYCSEVGLGLGAPVDSRESYGLTFADYLAACSRRQTWDDYTSDNELRAKEADAATRAIRFAVEYLTHDVARNCGVEL